MDELEMTYWERRKTFLQLCRRKIRFFIGSRLPDARIEWKTARNGKQVPVCPRCGDFVYYKRQCTSCGQHFLPGAITIGEALDHGQ